MLYNYTNYKSRIYSYILNRFNNCLRKRKKSELKSTPSAGNFVDRGTELVGSVETASALGRIALKTTKDIVRGDSICKELCLVYGTCETIAFGWAIIQIILFLVVNGKIFERKYFYA